MSGLLTDWWPVLTERWSLAQRRGFLGSGPLESHVEHARGLFDTGVAGGGLDLGSGAGVPGLILAALEPEASWTLLEGSRRRAAFLESIVRELGEADRIAVVHSSAEAFGRGPGRSAFGTVVARSFGPPAVSAECGSPLLCEGGSLWVCEPPSLSQSAVDDRWPAKGCVQVGLGLPVYSAAPVSVVRLRRSGPLAEDLPREHERIRRRPLW